MNGVTFALTLVSFFLHHLTACVHLVHVDPAEIINKYVIAPLLMFVAYVHIDTQYTLLCKPLSIILIRDEGEMKER